MSSIRFIIKQRSEYYIIILILFNAKFNHLVKYYPEITIESKKTGITLIKFGRFTIGKMRLLALFFQKFNVLYTMNAIPYNYYINEVFNNEDFF